MKKLAVLCANGVEEIETLSVVDFCRRAGIDVRMISVSGHQVVTGSHQIRFFTDGILEEIDLRSFDAIVLPGGPGHAEIEAHEDVMKLVSAFYDSGKLVAAICASPGILASLGILDGRRAAVYPGLARTDTKAIWTEEAVECEGNVITANGPAAGTAFAVEIIRYLEGSRVADQVSSDICL